MKAVGVGTNSYEELVLVCADEAPAAASKTLYQAFEEWGGTVYDGFEGIELIYTDLDDVEEAAKFQSVVVAAAKTYASEALLCLHVNNMGKECLLVINDSTDNEGRMLDIINGVEFKRVPVNFLDGEGSDFEEEFDEYDRLAERVII